MRAWSCGAGSAVVTEVPVLATCQSASSSATSGRPVALELYFDAVGEVGRAHRSSGGDPAIDVRTRRERLSRRMRGWSCQSEESSDRCRRRVVPSLDRLFGAGTTRDLIGATLG